MKNLQALNLKFEDLYSHKGLLLVNEKFNQFFLVQNPLLYNNFLTLKNTPQNFSKKQRDDVIINSAKVLEDFLVFVFDIEKENNELKNQHKKLEKIYYAKREFVQRIVAKKFSAEPLGFNIDKVVDELKISHFFDANHIENLELELAQKINQLLEKEKNLSEEEKTEFEILTIYTAWALYSKEGRLLHQDGALFNLPQKIDYENLCQSTHGISQKRDGFDLSDNGFNLNQTLAQANYCIFCHNQEKDSCRTGLREKDGGFKKNPLEIELKGCPLNQKISEMNLLKTQSFSIAAIAVAAIDNPLMAGTGHRICNDCMKSCIYQKQDPVNIPQIETQTLKDLLRLPYGFEIYSLLTRFNPLNFGAEIAAKNSGKKVLIAGLGPAGYSLAHDLLNQGHEVVAIDGLKIEPLNPAISGIDAYGQRQKFEPIKYIDEIFEPLSSRLIQGFGGVSEYGITVRWNKNFLTIIRLLLERRENFRMFGGLRFGSSITEKIAFDEYGFDHVALCIGAGRPHIVDIKNNFAKGIRAASDFLMSLQLTGAFKENLFTNLQIRAPIIVVGAGLTAVDTACEAQEYYFVQIKKFAAQIKKISTAFGAKNFWQQLSEEEKNIAQEFLQHAQILETEGRTALLKTIGATKILYRKKIQNSPAYRLNHEELIKAFEQNIEFVAQKEVDEAILDEFGHIKAIKCKDGESFACRSLLVAAGTDPNIAPATEDGLDLQLQGKYFAAIKENSLISKIDEKGRAVSFFGDLHPSFAGNVVKAMASAKVGGKEIDKMLQAQQTKDSSASSGNFLNKINHDFLVKIAKINQISPHVVEIFIHAPLLANQALAGHIFRLQNYHVFAKSNDAQDQLLAMEGVPVTALDVDRSRGIISGIVTLYGASTNLIKNFKEGEPCIFMGPSGKPTEIIPNETVVLIGGGRGNMPLTAIAKYHKQHNCKTIIIAGYRKNSYLVRQEEMEKHSDILIYAIEEEVPQIKLNRAQDRQYQGTVLDAIKKYFAQDQQKIDRIFAIGSDKMMAKVAQLRHENVLQNFSQAPIAITSLNAPMQCMMKGVCSQCLQKRVGENGEMEYFYSCAAQDQNMDKLDFAHLHARCAQNSLQEKVTGILIKLSL